MLYTQLGRILHGDKVRQKIDEVADKIETRAKDLADADDQPELGREDGERPKGRPYARITIDAAHEFGTATVVRQRLLGQAIAEVGG